MFRAGYECENCGRRVDERYNVRGLKVCWTCAREWAEDARDRARKLRREEV